MKNIHVLPTENCCTPSNQIKRYKDCIGCDRKHKQETQGYICPKTKILCDDECCVSAEECHIEFGIGIQFDCEEPKQETLEQAAEKHADIYRCPATNQNEYCKHDIISAFNNGAKWQQERSYSEEELREAFEWGVAHITFEEWIKKYKKK